MGRPAALGSNTQRDILLSLLRSSTQPKKKRPAARGAKSVLRRHGLLTRGGKGWTLTFIGALAAAACRGRRPAKEPPRDPRTLDARLTRAIDDPRLLRLAKDSIAELRVASGPASELRNLVRAYQLAVMSQDGGPPSDIPAKISEKIEATLLRRH